MKFRSVALATSMFAILAAPSIAYAEYGSVAGGAMAEETAMVAAGYGTGDTREEAMTNAISGCADQIDFEITPKGLTAAIKQISTLCQVRLTWKDSCGFITTGTGHLQDGRPRASFGYGPTREEAIKQVIGSLTEGGAVEDIKVRTPIGGCPHSPVKDDSSFTYTQAPPSYDMTCPGFVMSYDYKGHRLFSVNGDMKETDYPITKVESTSDGITVRAETKFGRVAAFYAMDPNAKTQVFWTSKEEVVTQDCTVSGFDEAE